MEEQSNPVFWVSPQQKRVWLTQGESCWNVVCLVRLEGPVDPGRLEQALRRVTSRHEALRTVYRFQPGIKIPFQTVLETAEPGWDTLDWSGLDSAAHQNRLDDLFRCEQSRQFDFERGPAIHARFISLGPDRAAWILTLPALSGDAPSLKTLVRETGLVYADQEQSLPAEPLRYTQFAQWQNDLLECDDRDAEEAKAYWNQQNSATESALVLPQECTKTCVFRSESVAVTLHGAILSQIDRTAETFGTSNGSVLLAAWQSLLWRLSGQPHFSTQVFFDGRQYEELENAVGAIGKFLPIPARFDGAFNFKDIVEHVAALWKRALQWQEYFAPEDAPQDASPLCFEYTDLPAAPAYAGVTFGILRNSACGERFRLKLSVQRSGPALQLELHYDADRVERETVQRWLGHFRALLTEAVADPRGPVNRLPLLTESERRQLLEAWNKTEAEYPKQLCVQELFEAQAVRTPERAAVCCGDHVLTYRELNERANQLAHHLRRLGVRPDNLVGLCVERNTDMIVGLLAILKAGGAYVPVNAENPKARLAQQLAGVVALITDAKMSSQMPQLGCPWVSLDGDFSDLGEEPRSNPEGSTTPENLAYVIFTSGSTGVPKGVGVRHRNLVNYASFIGRLLELEKHADGLHFATVSTLSADLGNTSIFPALLSGGCLHVISHETAVDSQRMADYQQQHKIDVLKIVPSHLEALLEGSEGAAVLPRKYLILGGETLTRRLVDKVKDLGAHCEIFNHYGPTETTIGSLTLRVRDYQAGSGAQTIPIGRPISNTQVYILDSCQQPVPIGVVGELYIAGAGVTAGYLNQPELTSERFPDNPYLPGKMYRTGDLARYGADGHVEFLGRGDDQVKIRGFRIELGEVEAVLARHGGVKQAAVVTKPDSRGDKRLIGYVVTQREHPVTSEEMHDYLKKHLPDYMIPAALVVLPKLPLTANGKIDRQSLPEPEQVPARAYVAPRTATEETLIGIWTEVFRGGNLGCRDNFFEIGGHSLMATQVISRVRQRFQVALDIRVVFERPTIEGMAEAIEAARDSASDKAEPEIVPVSRERYRRR